MAATMRLLAIRLQNLNSLSGALHEVRLDIPPLSQAGVFLITGPTGAGKSTLLDAVTLALYGRAARYGNDRADEMLSRHSPECLAEVDFETQGRQLRATWRFGKTKTGNSKPTKRSLSDIKTGEILAEKAAEMDKLVSDLTGLDAQRFLRSVLLAQGQFASFLKAKASERAELLEKITGTEIYSELSALAFETHKAKTEAFAVLDAAHKAIKPLEAIERSKLEADLIETRVKAGRLAIESQAATKRCQEQREHAAILSELTKLAEAARAIEKSLAESDAELSKAKALNDDARQQRAEREPIWEQAAGLAAQSDQLESDLVISRATYQKQAKAQKDAAARREAADKALAAHREAAGALEAWLKQNAVDAQLAETLPALRAAVREWRLAFEKLAEGRKRCAEAQALEKKIGEAEANGAALAKKAADCAARTKADRTALDQLTKALEAQRELENKAALVAGFDEHRHDLKAGEPCPLCGANEHPFVTSGEAFESQLQAARKLLASLEAQREKAMRDLATLERDLAKMEAEAGTEKKRMAEMQKALGEIVVPDIAALKIEEARTRRGTTLLHRDEDAGQASNLVQRAERELDALEKRAAAFAKKQQEAAQQRHERQKLESEIGVAKADEAAKTSRLEELKAEGTTLRAKADALKAQVSELLGGRPLIEDRQHFEALTVNTEKALRAAEVKLTKLQTDLAAVKAKHEQLEARRQRFGEQPALDASALAELEKKAAELHEAFASSRTVVGSLEQQIKNDDDSRQRSESSAAELKNAEVEALRWGRLKELIGSADGSKFARFAQSLTLRQLISLANHHLQVLAPRYRLIAADGTELDLRIVDLYQAGVDRPMESLSGGESFLASLALALGLSELASRHHPIDSLFIDEGFGTLDSETLEIALSALENLRASGKTIGLISHVELLKERLGTQVRIIRSASGTSRIEVV